ncbi:MAG: PCP reductase family protein [Scytonema sp. PMC 1070.18]|nr:PCP reductase family protein [Scytonema sp. PMC 1070.18]
MMDATRTFVLQKPRFGCMDGLEFSDTLRWTTEAQVKLKKIPFFVRSQAKARIEQLARQAQQEIVTADIVELARAEFGQ